MKMHWISKRKRYITFCFVCCILIFLSKIDSIYAVQDNVYKDCKNDEMKIALTFDDGPHPEYTKQILDILDQYEIKATFFMVGENVDYYPEIAKEVIRRGNEVGNHTYTHCSKTLKNKKDLMNEMERCQNALYELCEYRPGIFRPPGGYCTKTVTSCAAEYDFGVILWNIDTRDWAHTKSEKIVDNVLNYVSSGDILLFHDYISGKSPTPEALKRIIPELLSRGYQFVTVSELIYSH